mgnify:CR=1 FL=1
MSKTNKKEYENKMRNDLTVDWKKNVGIGEYKEERWRDNRRA